MNELRAEKNEVRTLREQLSTDAKHENKKHRHLSGSSTDNCIPRGDLDGILLDFTSEVMAAVHDSQQQLQQTLIQVHQSFASYPRAKLSKDIEMKR